VHIARAEIAQAIHDPSYRVRSERFDRRSGLPGQPAQVRRTPTAVEGTDGRLWFSVSGAVFSLDPKRRAARLPAPPVSIQSVEANNERQDLERPLRFAAGTSNVRIAYAAVSLLHPDSIRFRYRLQGADDDWREAGRLTSVAYRTLPPGDYRFEVDASDANGIWSGKTAAMQFTILPAYYQTPWFRALCVLLLLALAWAGYRLRIRRLRRRFEMTLEARVAERMRIARDLHDTLLQSVQSLLPRLQAVSQLLPARAADAKSLLLATIDRASDAIAEGRTAVQGLRGSVTETNNLSAAIRTLADALATEHSAHLIDVRVEIQGAPRALHPLVRDEIFRIAGEALRNAYRHAEASRVEVEVRYEPRRFQLRVRDDGRGMDPKILVHEGRAGHFGLRGMRERAKLIGGTLTVWSAEGAGTEVDLVIPAAHAYSTTPSAARDPLVEEARNT
jgi:signal transduction histidine kinase